MKIIKRYRDYQGLNDIKSFEIEEAAISFQRDNWGEVGFKRLISGILRRAGAMNWRDAESLAWGSDAYFIRFCDECFDDYFPREML